jgi:hypothetical protein
MQRQGGRLRVLLVARCELVGANVVAEQMRESRVDVPLG